MRPRWILALALTLLLTGCTGGGSNSANGRITLRFGRPMYFDAISGTRTANQARRAATDDIMDAIWKLSGQERASTYADLPAE